MLGAAGSRVFSKCAVFGTSVRAQHTRGNQRVLRRRRKRRAVLGRRHPVRAGKARGERADTAQADGEADRRHRAIRRAEQCCRALQPAVKQIRMRGLAEHARELATEMGSRQTGGSSEIVDTELITVRAVDQILRAQQMTLWRVDAHPRQYCPACQPSVAPPERKSLYVRTPAPTPATPETMSARSREGRRPESRSPTVSAATAAICR